MKKPKSTVGIEKSESSAHTFKACRGDSSNESCPTPQPNDIWVEVGHIPKKVQAFNKLRIPGHLFVRREFLEESPPRSWTKRNKRMH